MAGAWSWGWKLEAKTTTEHDTVLYLPHSSNGTEIALAQGI